MKINAHYYKHILYLIIEMKTFNVDNSIIGFIVILNLFIPVLIR